MISSCCGSIEFFWSKKEIHLRISGHVPDYSAFHKLGTGLPLIVSADWDYAKSMPTTPPTSS